MDNETTRPHMAVLSVQVEVHSLTDSGECSGRVLNSDTLKNFGLKPSFLLKVDGVDAEDCLKKLKNKLMQWVEP
jgi:hypothetical protein